MNSVRIRHQRIAVNNHRYVHATIHEPRTDATIPTIVCESGLGLSRFMWGRIIPPLVRSGARVVVYDRAGMGRSPLPVHHRGISHLTGDLQSVIEATAPHGAICVGHSYGGLIIRTLADQHPNLITAMVLVDPSTEDVLTETHPAFKALDAIIQRALEGAYAIGAGPLILLAMGYWRLPKNLRHQALKEDSARSAARSRRLELNHYAQTLTDLANNPPQTPRAPVILVAAQASEKAATTKAYKSFIDSIPGAQLTWAHTSSHMVPLVDPRSVINAIKWATCHAYNDCTTCAHNPSDEQQAQCTEHLDDPR